MFKQTSGKWVAVGIGLALMFAIPTILLAASQRDDHFGYQLQGVVQSMPPSGLIGAWTINGITLTTDSHTQFRGMAPADGSCVFVIYQPMNSQNLVLFMSTSYWCGWPQIPGGISVTHGVIQSFPPGLIGAWQVSSNTYTTSASTHFEQAEGPFQVGACVQVRFVVTSSEALSISTDNGGDMCPTVEMTGVRELQGTLIDFPADLTGTWTVSATS